MEYRNHEVGKPDDRYLLDAWCCDTCWELVPNKSLTDTLKIEVAEEIRMKDGLV